MQGAITRIKQSFIYARNTRTEVSLRNLTAEERPVIKALKWFSLDEVRNCKDIVYPVLLSEYFEVLLRDGCPERPVVIDLTKAATR